LVLATAAVGVVAAPYLPPEMAIGWRYGFEGPAVTHGPRAVWVALLPALAHLALVGLCVAQGVLVWANL
jgi:hypothetical protein